MTVLIERRNPDTDELEEMARVDGGDVISGSDELADFWMPDDLTEADLLDRFRGPTIFARQLPDADAETAASAASWRDQVPVIPSGQDRLTKGDLARWFAWVSVGRPDTEPDQQVDARKFNPELHPRGPDGKFVERPWDIPDDLDLGNIRTTPTVDLLEALDMAGEPVDDALSDPNLRIDGIPDDVSSIEQARKSVGEEGLVFQDVELNDQLKAVDGQTGDYAEGTVKKTEVVNGAPNRIHLSTDSGPRVIEATDDHILKRTNSPSVPPAEAMGKDPLTYTDVDIGDPVMVTHNWKTGVAGSPAVTQVGTVDGYSDLGETGISVDGEEYDANHPNIQLFDPLPDEIDGDTVEVGDEIQAWAGSAKLTEGEVVSYNEDLEMFQVADPNADGTTPVAKSKNTTFYPATDIDLDGLQQSIDDGADDVGEMTDDAGADPSDVDLDPDAITAEDFDPSAYDNVANTSDPDDVVDAFSEGDWALVRREGEVAYDIGKITETSDASYKPHKMDVGPTTVDVWATDPYVARLDESDVQDAVNDTDVGVKTDHIDPASIDIFDLSEDDWAGNYDDADSVAADFSEGDWAKLNDQVGIVSNVDDDGTVTVATGENEEDWGNPVFDDLGLIDDQVIADKGSPYGADTGGLEEPDTPDPDVDVEDVSDTATDTVITEDNLNHAVTDPDSDDFGVLPTSITQSFDQYLRGEKSGAGKDITSFTGDETTVKSDYYFPRLKGSATADLTAFMNQSETLPNATKEDSNSSFGTSNTIRELQSAIGDWKGKSYTDNGQHLEKAFHGALDLPGDLRDDGLDSPNPTESDVAAAALLSRTSQDFISRHLGDFETVEPWGKSSEGGQLPLYRGPGEHATASLARDFLEDPDADTITIEESKIGNYTTDPTLAAGWTDEGIVIKRNTVPEEVVYSPDVIDDHSGIDNEAEIWLTGGVSETDPSMISVKGDRTLDEIMGADPTDLTLDEKKVIGGWVNSMDNESDPLTATSQIETLQTMRQENDFPGFMEDSIDRVIEKSQQWIEDPDSVSWDPAVEGPDVEQAELSPDLAASDTFTAYLTIPRPMKLTDPESQNWLAEARRVSARRPPMETDEQDPFRVAEAASYGEGDKVEYDGARAIVVEVRTGSEFEGPDGETYDPSEDDPVYIVATEDGSEVATGDDLDASDWSTDMDDPTDGLDASAEATVERLSAQAPADHDLALDGSLSIDGSVTDWDYPESWDDSPTPNRLILLDAWSSMGAQFDCGGGCCMGTMMSSGMPRGRAAEFCASMKDRVLLWEGWRQGG